MTMMSLTQTGQPVSNGFRVDVSRGERVGRVSSEWFSRPDDERYLSLTELHDAVRRRAEHAQTRTVESRAARVEASRDSAERLVLLVPGRHEPIAPTHWSFGQLRGLVGPPSSYLRQLPAALAGINLQHGLLSHRGEQVKTLEAGDGRVELRAVTGPDYGRIWDHELVAAVIDIAGNGTGDTRWKVPGVLDWKTMAHNPFVDITKETTTLYASDRDVFLFLVDDTHPIEAGRLRDGSPDLYFRGFYCWNSEIGSKMLGIASFYLCCLHEPQSLGCREFRGNHHPAFQVRCSAVCSRGGPGADALCRLLTSAVHHRHQGRARADRRPHGRGSRRVLAQARVLQVGDGENHRDRVA
jgi:hypothetical protein